MSQQFVQIPFGPGLDKESGAMVVKPGSMLDLRNVYHHEGSLVARHGMEKRIQFTDYQTGNPATHILAGIAIRSERVGIVVSFYEPTRHVTIHRVDGTASYGTPLGNWPFSVDPVTNSPAGPYVDEWPGTDIPKVILEEIFGQVYFAHDERYIASRAATWVYDPYWEFSSEGGLAPLVVYFENDHRYSSEYIWGLPIYDISLDREQAEIVKFRGVSRHMDYLFGWGYGTRLENRPEMVRVSYPGEPRRWHPEHYFIAGDRRDPVIRCEPARQTMLCFKETETYQIFGYSRATFGIRPYDQLYGCLAGRLARTVSGEVFFWSAEGPRMGGDVGPSQKIHLPLDLGGFEPSTLVERTDFDEGWCDYIDEVEQLYFGFGRRLYCLSLRNPRDPRWTYWELARKAYCGFRLYGETGAPAPDGYPDNLSISNVTVPACTLPSIRVQWDNNDQLEDENYIDIWVKPNSPWWTESNLLPNPLDGSDTPTGWSVDTTGFTAKTGSYTGGTADDGQSSWRCSLYGSGSDGEYIELYQVVTGADVVVGNEYRFEAITRAYYDFVKTATRGIYVKMAFLDSGDTPLSTVTRRFTQGKWAPIYITGTAPASTAKIKVSIGGDVTAGGRVFAEFKRPELLTKAELPWRRIDLGRPAPIITGDATQSVTLSGLRHPGMEYQIAARYTNLAGFGGTGYTGTPDTWPAGSKTTHTTDIQPPYPFTRGSAIVIGWPTDVAEEDALGTPWWLSYAACASFQDDGPAGGARGPYRLPVEVEWDENGGYAYLSERFDTQRISFYDPDDFNGTDTYAVVRMRYLGADANSAWSQPVTVQRSLNQGGDAPTVTVTSPSSGTISIDWAWGSTAAPDGYLRALMVECDYDGDSDTGDWILIYGTCGVAGWLRPPTGDFPSLPVCLGTLPPDPWSVTLPGTPGGVTVSVRVREVYAPTCPGPTPYAICGWNSYGFGYIYGPYSDSDSVTVTS